MQSTPEVDWNKIRAMSVPIGNIFHVSSGKLVHPKTPI